MNQPNTTTLIPQSSDASLLPGVNILLEGPTGTGKTHSIGTLVDAGVEVFYLALEPGLESLIGYWTDRQMQVPPNLHWNFLSMNTGGFKALIESSKTVGDMDQDSLYKLKDFSRSTRNYFHKLLETLNNFPDQRDGKTYGPVDSWGPNKAIILDGLTGLGDAAWSMVIGNKAMKSQADWGIAQDHIDKLLNLLCNGCKCHFVLLAHVERETDAITGGSKVTVATLGKALPPKIPPKFSDVILTNRMGNKWSWSTAALTVDLKTRNLPIAEGITPDFKQIIDKWKSRGGRLSPVVKS